MLISACCAGWYEARPSDSHQGVFVGGHTARSYLREALDDVILVDNLAALLDTLVLGAAPTVSISRGIQR